MSDRNSAARSLNLEEERSSSRPGDPLRNRFRRHRQAGGWKSDTGPSGVRVSVILPFLNAERYIEEAIRSVLAQTYRDWELLLIDDGSTDDSAAIARRFADQYPERIRYFAHPGRENRGANAARNLGISHARGEYVAIHDADDFSERRRIAKQVSFLDAHPEVALLGTQCTVIDGNGALLGKMKLPCSWIDLRWELLFSTPFVHSSVMLRKEVVLHTVGCYDERLRSSQDYEFWCRIVPHLPAANLRQYLVRYRVHPHSISKTHETAAEEFRHLRLKHLMRLLGWKCADEEQNEQMRAIMTALVFGWPTDAEPGALRQTVNELLRLQHAFATDVGLKPSERRRHLARLHLQLVRNLVAEGAARRGKRSSDALALLRLGFDTHWPALFRPHTLLRCCGILARLPIAGRTAPALPTGRSDATGLGT